ncbi:MAG: hypothetical protein ABS52_04385 [Gemmatimonadetes bacterium SCN 70-22]|nr:MAG: hypothetical protein ABS52_04385 [Gemmatimonadetes bacterium SCN 70-22]
MEVQAASWWVMEVSAIWPTFILTILPVCSLCLITAPFVTVFAGSAGVNPTRDSGSCRHASRRCES